MTTDQRIALMEQHNKENGYPNLDDRNDRVGIGSVDPTSDGMGSDKNVP